MAPSKEGSQLRLAPSEEPDLQAPEAWIDPEPAEAGKIAAEVVHAPWNQDKTTRLAMSITTLVDRRSGLVGYSEQLAPVAVSLEERLQRLGAKIGEKSIRIRLSGAVLFDFDSSSIRPDAERVLGELAEILQAYEGRSISIEGHTDSVASEAYNQTLSEQRAASVRDWLAEHGVDPGRVSTRGFGELMPLEENSTARGRQQNRRVEIVIDRG